MYSLLFCTEPKLCKKSIKSPYLIENNDLFVSHKNTRLPLKNHQQLILIKYKSFFKNIIVYEMTNEIFTLTELQKIKILTLTIWNSDNSLIFVHTVVLFLLYSCFHPFVSSHKLFSLLKSASSATLTSPISIATCVCLVTCQNLS